MCVFGVQGQTVVTAYFLTKQLLLFVFVWPDDRAAWWWTGSVPVTIARHHLHLTSMDGLVRPDRLPRGGGRVALVEHMNSSSTMHASRVRTSLILSGVFKEYPGSAPLDVTRRSRWWRPRRLNVQTSVLTLFSHRATRCELLHPLPQGSVCVEFSLFYFASSVDLM